MTLVAEYRKALANYNPGAPTRDLSGTAQMLAGGSLAPQAGMEPWTASMGPGVPLPAQPLDDPKRGINVPRRWQYPVGTNLSVTPGSTKLVDFRTLRMLAKVYDIARRCIEIRRQEISSMRWEVTPKDPKAKIEPERQKALTSFFEYPDRINGRRWDGWIKTLLEEVFVVDALAIYPHPTWAQGKGVNGSDLFALEILDGTTIKPLLDNRGARPMPPLPAYQQVLYGVPRTEMLADSTSLDLQSAPLAQEDVLIKPYFSGDELYYEVYNPASDSPYGFSNIEQIIVNVNLALKRQQYWTSYFTDGTIPAGLVQVPVEWDVKQWREAEETWNSMLAGDMAWKHRVKFSPGPFTQLRPQIGEGSGVVLFDEWLAKITCIGFDVTPTELGLDPKSGLGGTGWNEQQENVLYRKSLRPITGWVEVLLDEILATWLQSPDVRFRFIFDEIEDAVKKAQQFQIEFQNATKTANEHRGELGLPPSSEPNANELIVVTRQGPILLRDIDAVSSKLAGGGKLERLSTTTPATADPGANPEGTAPPPGDTAKVAEVTKAGESTLRDPKSNVLNLDSAALRRVIEATATVPTVILCRHGSTKNNEEGLLRGWLDPELSTQGKKDARQLAAGFKGAAVAKLYCSGLKRSCDTADAIAKVVGVDATVDDRFKPWNLGDFQGKPVQDSLDRVIELMTTDQDTAAPGGESFNAFVTRYIPALKEAFAAAEQAPNQFVVIVAHMRNQRAARAWFDAGMKGTKVNTDSLVSDDEVGPGGFMVFAKENGKWGIPAEYTDEVEDESAKKAAVLDDLRKWQTKALKALKAGRSAAVTFDSSVLSPGLRVTVSAALSKAVKPDEVRDAINAAIQRSLVDAPPKSDMALMADANMATAKALQALANRPQPPAPIVNVAAPHVEVAPAPAPQVDVHVQMPPEHSRKKITGPDGKVTLIESA
ncbi:MAG TPA: histidine phosphatase family protein [Candidatus Acidoferrum sp.]|nr:histidine phosphatase family protein [Candidatus Acidoferrum sp.]